MQTMKLMCAIIDVFIVLSIVHLGCAQVKVTVRLPGGRCVGTVGGKGPTRYVPCYPNNVPGVKPVPEEIFPSARITTILPDGRCVGFTGESLYEEYVPCYQLTDRMGDRKCTGYILNSKTKNYVPCYPKDVPGVIPLLDEDPPYPRAHVTTILADERCMGYTGQSYYEEYVPCPNPLEDRPNPHKLHCEKACFEKYGNPDYIPFSDYKPAGFCLCEKYPL